LTHFRIVQSVGPNSLDRSPHLRPAQNNSTICLRNSAGYFVPLFDISDSFSVDTEVSTKTGQVHIPFAALLKLRAYRYLGARIGMSDNRCDDGVETPLCQRRKVSFQFAIVFNQGVAKFGD